MASAVKNLKLPPFVQEEDYQAKVNAWKLKNYGRSQDWAELSDLAKEFASYKDQKDALEEQMSRIKLAIEALGQMIVEKMTAEDLQNLKLNNGSTVYLNYEMYPQIKDREQLIEWLKRHKLGSLLTVNYRTLQGLVNDLSSEGKGLPAGVEAYLKTQARLMRG